MWVVWMGLGLALGAAGVWFGLACLVARRLRHLNGCDSGGLKEKVRVGEKMVAVVIGSNGKRRNVE